MVQVTGEIGEPPERVLDIWALDELRGHQRRGRRARHRRPDDLHRAPPLPDRGRVRARPRRGRGHHRCGADPESRDDRRQRHQRLAGRRHAARAAGSTGAEMVLGSATGERTVAADDFWPAYRTTAPDATTSCCCASGSRSPRTARCGSARSARGARRRSARSSWRSAWSSAGPDDPWTDVRLALGSVAATTVRAPPPRRRSRASGPRGRPPTRRQRR